MRDKNHPSVIMWSIANEPDSESPAAAAYFKHVATQTRALDPSRPVTFATFKNPDKDVAAQHVDLIMINRYFAWYTNTGQLDIISLSLEQDLMAWRRAFGKPIMIAEYGADAVAGLHSDPSYSFTEEFQSEYISEYFPIFDKLRAERFFVGEHIWNFADFMTNQGVTRVYGNKKGLFTRQRQPKMAAYTIRQRYQALANSTQLFPGRLRALQKESVLPVGDGYDEAQAGEAAADDSERPPRTLPDEEDVVSAQSLEEAAAMLEAGITPDGAMGPTHVWQDS